MQSADFNNMRRMMVESQLRTSGVTDAWVLAAMGNLPREDFVPEAARSTAYMDRSIALADGSLLNPPVATALMLQAAEVKADDNVLFIGRADGYAATLLATRAATTTADGAGAVRTSGFSLIFIDGAVEELPDAIVSAAQEGARIVTGLAERGVTSLALGIVRGGKVALRRFADSEIAPLPEFARKREFVFLSSKSLVIAGLLASATFAAPAAADTLRDALVSAYDTNPSLTAAREGQKAIDEGVPLAKAAGRPSADASVSYTENLPRASGGTNFSPDRLLTVGPSASVPLYAGGSIRNAVRAAENRVEAGFANLRGTESAIFSAVVGAYMDVIRDEAIVDLNRTQVAVLSVNLEATRDRFEIGDLTRTDVAQSEARLALQTSQLESARAQLIRSKETYIQLVGRVPGELEAPPPLPGLPDTPDAAVAVSLENNPDLISAREGREAARFDRKAADASRLPFISAVGGSTYSNNLGSIDTALPYDRSSHSAQIGVRASIPLYQGGEAGARIRQAQARLGQAQEFEIAAERDAIAQTRASYASWKASQEVITASERAVSANTLSLEGVRAENSVGNRTILDILNAEQELLNSQVQLVTARRNAYVAGFSLLAAMGRAEARDLGLEGGPLYDPIAEYEKVEGAWTDWDTNPDPTVKSTRTVDTPAQKADIEPIPEYKPGVKR